MNGLTAHHLMKVSLLSVCDSLSKTLKRAAILHLLGTAMARFFGLNISSAVALHVVKGVSFSYYL